MRSSMKKDVAIVTCVGGGPMERLARALSPSQIGWGQGHVLQMYSSEQWRHHFTSGKWGRSKARFRAFLGFPIKVVLSAIHPRWQVLVPTTNPFHLPLVLVATRWLHGKPVVPLIYDLYPDALEAGGYASVGGLFSRLMEWGNRILFRRCDGAVFIGHGMARHAIDRYGEPRSWTVLETGADVGEFSAPTIAANTTSTSNSTTSVDATTVSCHKPIIFSYVGNMGLLHDWETMASAIPVVLASCPSAEGVIAASGPGVELLRHEWGETDTRIRFLPPLPDDEWVRLLEKTDIALVTLRDSAAMTSIPSKTFSAMAASCAICAVAPARSDVARVVIEHDCGVVVAPGDVEGLIAAACDLCDNRLRLDDLQHKARQAAEKAYDVRVLAGRWQQFLNEVESRRALNSGRRFLKRALDVVGSLVGLLLLAPLLAVAALGVLLTMGRPVLFRQTRPGLKGKLFRIYKFRTMRHSAPGEPEGPQTDAVRLTRLGHFLRASSVDELPELLNVLRGEMSLVGPRPLLVSYLERYSPDQARRHDVKPGITGWAQINGRNALTWDDKFRLDVWYVDNQTFWLDVKILILTVVKVLRREGVSQAGHPTMPEFMGSAKGE